jgi:hypothetical protein
MAARLKANLWNCNGIEKFSKQAKSRFFHNIASAYNVKHHDEVREINVSA